MDGVAEVVSGREALCLRRLGYVPADPFDLTPAEIADIGIGVNLPPPRRPRLSSPLPSASSGPPSEEDERVTLNHVPMRGVTWPLQPPPVIEPPSAEQLVGLATDSPGLWPPIAWMESFDPIEPASPETPGDDRHSEDFDSDPVLTETIARHEREGPEFQRWKAEVTETTVKKVVLNGFAVDVRVPVIERRHRYRKQGTGSGRKPTRECNAEAEDEQRRREYVAKHGVPYEAFREISETTDAQRPATPEFDVRLLPEFDVPARLISEQIDALLDNAGSFCLFQHTELTPPRRALCGHASVLSGALPKAKPSVEDRAALRAVRARVPVAVPVVRMNDDQSHPLIAPVRGFELYVDSAAGRSLGAVPEPTHTDFVVTLSGKVLGPVECTVLIGQTVPKTANITATALKQAVSRLLHNRLIDQFFPDAYAAPCQLQLEAILKNAEPFDTILTRANVMAVLREMAYSVRRAVYAVKYWCGPPKRHTLTDLELMECQAFLDYQQCSITRGCLRRSDPRGFGTAMHDFVHNKSYLQVGGMAASSPISYSPLVLPLKAPVRQAAKLIESDRIPQIFNGRGERIYRYPPAETQQDVDDRAKQGTSDDQRSITTEQRIELSNRALEERRFTKAQKLEFLPLYNELVRTKSQSNLQRWKLINLLKAAGMLGNQNKVSQGSIRRDGLHHTVHRNHWYWSECFRAVTLGEDPCAVVYQRDVRDVNRRLQIEFREWVDEPVTPKCLCLRIYNKNKAPLELRSHSAVGWGECKLSQAQKNVVILAVYWCVSIRIKRRIKAMVRAEWYMRDVSESCRTIDLQIEELRCKLRGLGGLSQEFIAFLCR